MKSKIKYTVAICFAAIVITGCHSHPYDLTLDNQITAFQLKTDQQFVTWSAQAMADNTTAANAPAEHASVVTPPVACQAAPVVAGQTLSLISPASEPDSQFFNSVETDLTLIEARTKMLDNNPAIDQQIFGLRNIFYQIKYKRQHCSERDSPAYINIERKQVFAILQAMLTYQWVVKDGSATAKN